MRNINGIAAGWIDCIGDIAAKVSVALLIGCLIFAWGNLFALQQGLEGERAFCEADGGVYALGSCKASLTREKRLRTEKLWVRSKPSATIVET